MNDETIIAALVAEGYGLTDCIDQAIFILRNGALIDGEINYGVRANDHRMIETVMEHTNRYDPDFWSKEYCKEMIQKGGISEMANKEYVIIQSNEQLQEMTDYLKKENYSFSFDEDLLSVSDKDQIFIIDPYTAQVSCEDASKVFEHADIPVMSTQRFFSEEFDRLLSKHDYSFDEMQENQGVEDELIQDSTPITM